MGEAGQLLGRAYICFAELMKVERSFFEVRKWSE